MEKICPLRLGSDSWFCSNLSLHFFCSNIETVMITQVLGNLPSDSEIWFWKSNREKSLGLSEHNFQLFSSSPRGVVWRMKSLEARDAVQMERQRLFMKRQWTHQGELWVATLSIASSEVKRGMQLKLGEGTELCLVHQQVKPKNFTGKSHGRRNSCRPVWEKSAEWVPSGVCFSSRFLPSFVNRVWAESPLYLENVVSWGTKDSASCLLTLFIPFLICLYLSFIIYSEVKRASIHSH